MNKINDKNLPKITVIIPMRNEEKFIEKCLLTLLSNDYPNDLMEIIVVDGNSDDSSRKIVKEISKKHPNILLLNNEKKIVPTAMNIGIKKASGEIIIRLDSHSEYAPDYISKCVEYSQKTGAENVGGPMVAVGRSFFEKAVALATSTPFGVGNSKGRFEDTEGYYKAVYLGAYRKEVFRKIGLFDEELVRNQDEELNWRLIKNGGKIYITPNIKSYYYPRSTLKRLWKQYYEYGFWKVRLLQKHTNMMELRHFVPATMVAAFITALLLSLFRPSFIYIIILAAAVYLSANLLACIRVLKKEGWKYFLVMPAVFSTLHFSYGTGFLIGLIRFFNKWFIKEPEAPKLERGFI